MPSPEEPDQSTTAAQGGAGFDTTHWWVVARAGDSESPDAASAMERLCRTYWYPLYAFVRRKGHSHEDACDLTQAFFARFLEKRFLRSVDASLGKFRNFLLKSLTHFLANEWDKSRAQRRGGGAQIFSLDQASAEGRYAIEPVDHVTPELLFDRRWAQTLMAVVMDRLAAETDQRRFAILHEFLSEAGGSVSYQGAAERLGISVPAVTSAIHRMRTRFRLLVHEEIARTVQSPQEIGSELQHLLSALRD